MDEHGKVSLPLLGQLNWNPDSVTIALCGTTLVVHSGAFRVTCVFDCFESLGVPGGEE